MVSSGPEARLVAVLGPTNTGKTHLAIERMLARGSGVIGLPLRLLAREVYDKVCAAAGPQAAALVTGEERIAPPTARFHVCTVEAMPVDRDVAFVAVDEVQLAADPERGHVFTDRMLRARGVQETMLLGSETVRGLIRRLAPDAVHERRERFSKLTYAGAAKLSRLPKRSAVVAFSAAEVYAIAELLRRQRGGAAVVMGALSPRTRNAQVALYQSGEVDFLVATDAIGMGLNMDVEHVAFASLRKFDGRRRRPLRPDEIAQIAGRAGRFRADGTFGVTADQPALPEDVVERVESHDFEPIRAIRWRNHDLDLSSVPALVASLAESPPHAALQRCAEAPDEVALRTLCADPAIAPLIDRRGAAARLWAACQIPDFRKATIDQHVRLVAAFAKRLLAGDGRIPNEWAGGEIAKLENMNGDVDALAARLAHIRTWTYAANRADWFADPAHWRARARDVEDRLSDALHERLTQRFVDRRTSALVRGLKSGGGLEAHVEPDGTVEVEGHFVGRLDGLVFHPDRGGGPVGGLEARALRNAAVKALRPELDRRLGAIVKASDGDFALEDDLTVRWDGRRVARLAAGPDELHPVVALIGGELGAAAAQARAARRIEGWAQARVAEDLKPLKALARAVDAGELSGLARGVAFRLVENFGALDRREVAHEVHALSTNERRSLRKHGVRVGACSVFMPAMMKPKPARLAALLLAAGPRAAGPAFLPPPGATSLAVNPARDPLAYAAAGYRICGPRAVRLDMLERLADLVRAADAAAGPSKPFAATPEMATLLGCSKEELAGVLGALGYRRMKPPAPPAEDAPVPAPGELWRAPRPPKPRAARRVTVRDKTDSPFAALAPLAAAPKRRRRKPRRS